MSKSQVKPIHLKMSQAFCLKNEQEINSKAFSKVTQRNWQEIAL